MIACTRGPPRGARPGAAGAQVPGVRGVTTPLDVANALSKSLAKRVVVAEADGAEWDLFRPLRAPCALRLHTFDDDLGKHVRAPRRAGHRVGHRVGQRRAPGQARAGPACMGWGSELASRTCRAGPALRGVSSGRALVGAAGTQPAARLSNVSHRAPHARRAAPSLTCLSAVFGLTYKLALSTRPATYLGSLEVWDRAEASLTQALDATGLPWEVRAAAAAPASRQARGGWRRGGAGRHTRAVKTGVRVRILTNAGARLVLPASCRRPAATERRRTRQGPVQ